MCPTANGSKVTRMVTSMESILPKAILWTRCALSTGPAAVGLPTYYRVGSFATELVTTFTPRNIPEVVPTVSQNTDAFPTDAMYAKTASFAFPQAGTLSPNPTEVALTERSNRSRPEATQSAYCSLVPPPQCDRTLAVLRPNCREQQRSSSTLWPLAGIVAVSITVRYHLLRLALTRIVGTRHEYPECYPFHQLYYRCSRSVLGRWLPFW